MSIIDAPETGAEPRIAVRSRVLGDIEVDPKDRISFVEPIPGFPGCLGYVLVPHARTDGGGASDSVLWLQALEPPFHAFILTDPWSVIADYAPEIPDADAEQLRLRSFEDGRVMAILTVTSEGGVTINLRAPIVFNVVERLAKQVVLLSDQYHTRHRIGS